MCLLGHFLDLFNQISYLMLLNYYAYFNLIKIPVIIIIIIMKCHLKLV